MTINIITIMVVKMIGIKKTIIQLDLSGNYIREFGSIIEAAKYINKNHSHISQCVSGKRKTAYGYIWKLKKEK